MKNVLITGKNSYIGTSLKNWLEMEPEKYIVDTISVRGNAWEKMDFSQYDTIVHVAGIAHQDTKADQEELYFKVNRDLTIEVATKAKNEGVKQFVYMSSMIVYGASSKVGEEKVITKDTVPNPVNFYGKSKLEAEEGIIPLQSSEFNIAILRPPMIYGKGSKGNYPILAKFAKSSPIFPDIENKRSMLFIDNLTELIRLLIKNNDKGIYFPQNEKYVETSNMVKQISKLNKKKIHLTKVANPVIIKLLSKKVNIVNKVFGNLYYDLSMSAYKENYCKRNLEESLYLTERT